MQTKVNRLITPNSRPGLFYLWCKKNNKGILVVIILLCSLVLINAVSKDRYKHSYTSKVSVPAGSGVDAQHITPDTYDDDGEDVQDSKNNEAKKGW